MTELKPPGWYLDLANLPFFDQPTTFPPLVPKPPDPFTGYPATYVHGEAWPSVLPSGASVPARAWNSGMPPIAHIPYDQLPFPESVSSGGILPFPPERPPAYPFAPSLSEYGITPDDPTGAALGMLPPGSWLRGAWNHFSVPHDVMTGELDPQSDEARARTLGLAGLMTGIPRSGSLGVGGSFRGASSLPTDEATRMLRAQAMGFRTDMPLYHATAAPDFRQFDPAMFGSTTGVRTGLKGIWSFLDPEMASRFAEIAARRTGGDPRIIPLVFRSDKPAQIMLKRDPDLLNIDATIDWAWENKFDSIMFKNYSGPGGKRGSILVVKDPNQLRSPFALFDPARRKSADLLAGIAAIGASPLIFGSGTSAVNDDRLEGWPYEDVAVDSSTVAPPRPQSSVFGR
jgi:hypothetical protein